ncbi:hypothetical protein T492DRAFT_880870 [Pavlovales sp. CCMP2436]|nr:hypothetical protein T492DRAFT_880870 [Pavlovales sp. CCMP2436]
MKSVPYGDWFCDACVAVRWKAGKGKAAVLGNEEGEGEEEEKTVPQSKAGKSKGKRKEGKGKKGALVEVAPLEVAPQEEEEDTGVCTACGGGGADSGGLLVCGRCDGAYHGGCCLPPLPALLDGSWLCPYCTLRSALSAGAPVARKQTALRCSAADLDSLMCNNRQVWRWASARASTASRALILLRALVGSLDPAPLRERFAASSAAAMIRLCETERARQGEREIRGVLEGVLRRVEVEGKRAYREQRKQEKAAYEGDAKAERAAERTAERAAKHAADERDKAERAAEREAAKQVRVAADERSRAERQAVQQVKLDERAARDALKQERASLREVQARGRQTARGLAIAAKLSVKDSRERERTERNGRFVSLVVGHTVERLIRSLEASIEGKRRSVGGRAGELDLEEDAELAAMEAADAEGEPPSAPAAKLLVGTVRVARDNSLWRTELDERYMPTWAPVEESEFAGAGELQAAREHAEAEEEAALAADTLVKARALFVGVQVEVESVDDGLLGSWYPAQILRVLPTDSRGGKSVHGGLPIGCEVEVEYHTFEGEDGGLSREVMSVLRLRPLPPITTTDSPAALARMALGSPLELWHEEGWWLVELTHKSAPEPEDAARAGKPPRPSDWIYRVAPPLYPDATHEVDASRLRPARVWLRGNWRAATWEQSAAAAAAGASKLGGGPAPVPCVLRIAKSMLEVGRAEWEAEQQAAQPPPPAAKPSSKAAKGGSSSAAQNGGGSSRNAPRSAWAEGKARAREESPPPAPASGKRRR